MAKDRNTYAKRQRENAKRQKASEKLEKRKQRAATPTGDDSDGLQDEPEFTDVELKVLGHFRRYLMTPGDMLCFSGQEIESMRDGLEHLVERELLVSEGTHGAFSLTKAGFESMRTTG